MRLNKWLKKKKKKKKKGRGEIQCPSLETPRIVKVQALPIQIRTMGNMRILGANGCQMTLDFLEYDK